MVSSQSVAWAIRDMLVGMGDYGRSSGVRPWVVADLVRYFACHPPAEGEVFLLRAQGYSNAETASELGISPGLVARTVKGPLQCMVSLLQTANGG
jgi:DNA-directed RNA polymerase specialized sigma24 family protein